jgi:hypothetical protein
MHQMLNHLDKVFTTREQSPQWPIVSTSKVEKWDATFSTFKRLLGWDINMHTMTIHLPAQRHEYFCT